MMYLKVSDKEIESAFENTNFGGADKRKLLEQGVLKRLTGYHCGHTLTMIMRRMGLTTEKDNVTKRGKEFCMDAFYESKHSG